MAAWRGRDPSSITGLLCRLMQTLLLEGYRAT